MNEYTVLICPRESKHTGRVHAMETYNIMTHAVLSEEEVMEQICSKWLFHYSFGKKFYDFNRIAAEAFAAKDYTMIRNFNR
jgi:hypothetical protein